MRLKFKQKKIAVELAVDAYYAGGKAKVVGVLFENFSDEKPLKIISKVVDGVAPYESGNFYKRELPCIVSLLQDLDMRDISLIVIDGFVYLDGDEDTVWADIYTSAWSAECRSWA